jgi:hypothetical protein
VNTFEVAVLRILIKRQQPLKLSILVRGFPDDGEDSVLSAVSTLRLHGYIMISDYQPNGYVSINRERRKEILKIVDSNINSNKLGTLHTKDDYYIRAPLQKKRSGVITKRYHLSQAIRIGAISSLLIFGIFITVVNSTPTTSPDTEPIAFSHYMTYKKWIGTPGGYDQDGVKNHKLSYSPESISFVALKDCDHKPPKQRT